jgi:hypothetical protein
MLKELPRQQQYNKGKTSHVCMTKLDLARHRSQPPRSVSKRVGTHADPKMA